MRDAVVGGEELGVEDAAGVGACEVAGFGDRVEGLTEGGGVYGEVVDGFVGWGGDAGCVTGLREHGEDRTGVGSCERFALFEERDV